MFHATAFFVYLMPIHRFKRSLLRILGRISQQNYHQNPTIDVIERYPDNQNQNLPTQDSVCQKKDLREISAHLDKKCQGILFFCWQFHPH